MAKVVYNRCYGGFGLSYKAYKWLIEHGMDDKYLERGYNDEVINTKKNVEIVYLRDGNYMVRHTDIEQQHTDDELNKLCHLYMPDIPRHHPLLIQCVEELGSEASGPCAELAIHKLSGRCYRIEEYDGYETVHEPEDTDWIYVD